MTDDQRGTERWLRDLVEAGVHSVHLSPESVIDLLTGFDRLRAELAETRDRRDYLRGQLDLIYDAEYSRNDTLKRRIAVLEGAGNALADAAEALRDGSSSNRRADLTVAADSWRSAAGATPAANDTFQRGWREGATWQRQRIRDLIERAKTSDHYQQQLDDLLADDPVEEQR